MYGSFSQAARPIGAMRKFSSWTFLGIAIYLVLLCFAISNILNGPLPNYIK